MDRAVKLRKLEDFRRDKPHCSASALSQILVEIKRHGLPELTGRGAMREARDRVAQHETAYGPIVKSLQVADKDGVVLQLPYACPFASLTYALDESVSLQRLFKRQLSLQPSSPEAPWNIVLYTDEVTPGNPLATLNQRRFHAFYWSFAELGADALSHEESWFVVLVEFSTLVNTVLGGLSAVFAAVVKSFFRDGMHMQHSGVTMH